MAGPGSLALALVAIMALVLLSRVLGFSQRGILAGPDHAASLVQSLPGGFEPADVWIAREGSRALLRDEAGRVAIVAPNGAHFFARAAEPGWRVQPVGDGKVVISGSDFCVELDLGNDGGRWLAILAMLSMATG